MSFVIFLLGTLIASSAMLMLLLVAPRPRDEPRPKELAIVGAAGAAVLLAIGFIGGLSLAG